MNNSKPGNQGRASNNDNNSGLANVGRNANAQAQKTPARAGMEHWAKVVSMRVRSEVAHNPNKQHTMQQISDRAYSFYKKHALHSELLAKGPQRVRSNNGNPSVTPEVAEKKRNHSARAAKNVQFLEQSAMDGGPGKTGDNAFAFHVRPSVKNNEVDQKYAKNNQIIDQQGMSSRFSLTSDAFLQSGSNLTDSDRAKEYAGLTMAASGWSSRAANANNAKVMSAATLRNGRPDHAVLYGTIDNNPQKMGSRLAKAMDHGSKMTPLGMEPVAKGVSYGEFVRSQTVDNNQHAAPGFGVGQEPSSFGKNRAKIIASAVLSHQNKAENNQQNLNHFLNKSIKRHGYDVNNPARINDATKQARLARANAVKK